MRLFGRTLIVMLSACAIGGCTLPYEQLALPGPVAPPVIDVKPLASRGNGTPLSAPGTQSPDQNRVYQGSGEFAKEDQIRRSDAGAPATAPTQAGAPGNITGTNPSSQVNADGITINLANASVAEVAKTVLGDVLGFNYVVSDKVSANVTLRTVHPVDKAGLFEIFEAVLRAQEIAVVADGPLYKILPATEAAASGAPLRRRNLAGGGAVGLASEIVPLHYVAATEMERILKSAAPQAGILRVDSSRNLLLLSGTKSELASMSELIDVFDVDWMRGMSFGIFPVDTADPEAIAQELDVIFANDKDSPTKGIVRFVPNRRLKSVLVISSRPEYLKKAETWLARIDLATRATEKGVFVYHVQNRPAAELAQLLQKVYRPRGGAGQQSDRSSSLTSGSDPSRSTESGAAPLSDASSTSGGIGAFAAPSISAPTQPGVSSSAQPQPPGGVTDNGPGASGSVETTGSIPGEGQHSAVGAGLPPDDRSSGISVIADEPNNSLVITATPAEYRRIRNILQTIDITGSQVMIEATIAEVTLTDELKFGVRWFFEKGQSQVTLTDSVAGLTGPVFPGFSYFLRSANINAVVNALSTITDVNVVSSPTLMVLENKRALLQVGDEVPIATQSAVSVTTAGAPIVNSVSFRNTGVILGITPRVSDNGRVVLDIEQEVSDVVRTTTSTIDSPTIQQRRIKTTVNVQDGQSIILAGLIQDRSDRTRGQVPILGDIPYLGNAFKNKTDTIKRTELLIAITPQVIKDRQQIDDVTAEYRDKLNFSTRPQRQGPPDVRETLDRLQR